MTIVSRVCGRDASLRFMKVRSRGAEPLLRQYYSAVLHGSGCCRYRPLPAHRRTRRLKGEPHHETAFLASKHVWPTIRPEVGASPRAMSGESVSHMVRLIESYLPPLPAKTRPSMP